MRRTRKHIKEGGGGSTDSEDPAVAGIKETSKKKRHKGQTNLGESKGKTSGNKREEGRDSKGSEVSRRSTVREKCEGQASSARREQKQQKTTSDVTAPQTEQPPSNKTSKALGEHCLTRFSSFHCCKRRRKNLPRFQVEMWMTFSRSACGVSIYYSLWGEKNGKEQKCFFLKIHCRMRKH